MQIKILSKDEIYQDINNRIVKLVKDKPNAVLGFATGQSPVGVYQLLVDSFNKKLISFKDVTSFNLDEYYPIEDSNPQGFRYLMNHNLFNNVDIDKSRTNFPSIDNYQQYDQLIANAGGIDFQILGIGSNGHIAFNEPGTSFDSLTHLVKLADSTIKDNSRFFSDISKVPTQAITMGLKTIMQTKEIVLIATGKNKAPVIKQLIENAASINVPASVLKTHPNVTIYLDADAASLLC
ncbi:MAG: glucosamine-6-phosphate deaminase [Mycoplasmoidaceae bacterium]|nr:glucosamine-6-phosphate deaminase [Mycoplasmoidaceae bacterium]